MRALIPDGALFYGVEAEGKDISRTGLRIHFDLRSLIANRSDGSNLKEQLISKADIEALFSMDVPMNIHFPEPESDYETFVKVPMRIVRRNFIEDSKLECALEAVDQFPVLENLYAQNKLSLSNQAITGIFASEIDFPN